MYHRLASKANSLQMAAAQDDGRDTELELSTTFGDLHRQAVQFPVDSTVQPSKRLLALHAYAAWLQAQSLNPGVELTVPPHNFLDNETTGQAIYFLIDLWRNNVHDGPPPCELIMSIGLTCNTDMRWQPDLSTTDLPSF